jgi:seryl-tRNA synthetase
MKLLLGLLTILLLSCDNHQLKNNDILIDNMSDSIILKSNNSILISDTLNKKSDSITTTKVTKIIKEIQYLTKYVEKLRIEKSELSKELKVSKLNVRIDTVFIETKKSFWGKEKKTIKTTTDTQDIETIDSITTKVLDTININKY